MRRALVIICSLILLLGGPLAAQNDIIDSLEKKLEDTDLSQQERSRVLRDLSYNYYRIDAEVAEEYAKESLTLALAAGDEKSIAEAENVLAISYAVRSQNELALQHFTRSLKRFRSIDDKKMVAELLNHISGLHTTMNQSAKAKVYAAEALKIRQQLDDKEGIAKSQLTLGYILYLNGEMERARDLYDSSLVYFEKKGNTVRKVSILNHLGEIDLAQERYESARIRFDMAHKLVNPRSSQQLAYILTNMGKLKLQTGDFDHALAHLEEARNLSEKDDFVGFFPALLPALADVYDSLGRDEEAVTILRKELELLREKNEASRTEIVERLRLEFQTNQSEQENTFLKQQAELKDQELQLIRWLLITATLAILLLIIVAILMFRNARQKALAHERVLHLNAEVEEQRKALELQAAELGEANEEIRQINENLENMVMDRSLKVIEQNKKLKDFAYFNSHQVRAPLARILALSDLWQDELGENERKIVLSEIVKSAQELDRVVGKINTILQEEPEHDSM